ncbi:putative phage membrane protein [Streptococcus suis]|uniref:Phage membrane protein n=1 Tax=Streptococcus suis TaxID=1307 RepID=A0AB33UBA3_STRSU|nr:hypothetical protein [Streptococcus suis]QBX11515.1 hypothetical protein JavanS586_0005 [Streptococcus satellite phage Javan586]NQN58100.1 hypothetical protein [Streptococcus suis]NQS31738.1 hypothetical protein [Streptococcus suis]CYX61601.1 putative phage membrane protein [Streptococcus suis]HEM5038580.1 hypothetical protein [Streptococcus suis]
MQEIDPTIAMIFLVILTPLTIYLYFFVGFGTVELHSKPKIKPEGNHTRRLKNANYGAYIQSQGRYYN